jgi:hypothetical protein
VGEEVEGHVNLHVSILQQTLVPVLAQPYQDVFGLRIVDGVQNKHLNHVIIQLIATMKAIVRLQQDAGGKILVGVILLEEDIQVVL